MAYVTWGSSLLPNASARHERTLEAVRCSARLCQNPVFKASRLCKLLILLDRIFKKSTFDTVWRFVGLPVLYQARFGQWRCFSSRYCWAHASDRLSACLARVTSVVSNTYGSLICT